MARIYLVTSGGDRIVTSVGDPIYLRDLLSRYLDLHAPFNARGVRYLDFYAELFTKIVRYLDFHQDFEVHAHSGYQLYAKDLATGVVTALGFIPANGPLELTGVALADGDYEVEVRLQGYFWKDTRCVQRYPLRISGGEIFTPLPSVRNLAYYYNETDTRLSWTWATEVGTQTPTDFAIWTSLTDPVDTSGAPDYTVAASSPGDFSVNIAQAAALYVAVAARNGADIGPIALLTVPAPPAALDSPANQFTRFPI